MQCSARLPGPRAPPVRSLPSRNMTALSYSWTTLMLQMRERGRVMRMRRREQKVRRTAQRSGPSLQTTASSSPPRPTRRWEGLEKWTTFTFPSTSIVTSQTLHMAGSEVLQSRLSAQLPLLRLCGMRKPLLSASLSTILLGWSVFMTDFGLVFTERNLSIVKTDS